MAKQTHYTRLLRYLKDFGNITSLEAIRDLGNTRLSATIYQLREDGHNIESENKKVLTRWKNDNGTFKTTTITKYIYKDGKDW